MDDGTELDVRAGEAHEIPPGHDAWVVGDEAYVAVEWASSGVYGQTSDELGDRLLATILFTDIVESTAALARLGDAAWHRLLREHNVRLRAQLDRFRGREIETTGDGIMAMFDTPVRAVRCAAAMGPAVAELGIRIRAGLHTGEIELAAGHPRGVAVHAAARIAALAGPDEVLVLGHDARSPRGLGADVRGPRRPRAEGLHHASPRLRARADASSVRSRAVGPRERALVNGTTGEVIETLQGG